jgi:dipeptidyl aminopeptidase/acylaminoacyl peptidase
MNGVDAALAKYSWLDKDRLGVTGGSYGGYLTNWIISHTNRFKAAVTLRSISNFASDDGTRDGRMGTRTTSPATSSRSTISTGTRRR